MKSCIKCQQKNICKVYDFVKSFTPDIDITINNCSYATYQEEVVKKKVEKKASYADRIEEIKRIESEINMSENTDKTITVCDCCQQETEVPNVCSACGKTICESCVIINPLNNKILCEECFFNEEDEKNGSRSTEDSLGKIE